MFTMKLTSLLSLALSLPFLATHALPLNSGYLIGFGRAFDPTVTTKLSGVSKSTVVRGHDYCLSGNYCKKVEFGLAGGSVSITAKGVPIRGAPKGVTPVDGDSTFEVSASVRRLYQSNSCTVQHSLDFKSAQGESIGYAEDGESDIPWGEQGYTSAAIATNQKGFASFDGIVTIRCAAAGDSAKPPTVYVDAMSGSLL